LSTRISVFLQPRASKAGIVGMHGAAVHIKVTAPPVDNAANEALVELIAERLGIAKRQVRVVAGASSRRKIVEIDGVTADEATRALLSVSTRV
jgi:hypothetical protein